MGTMRFAERIKRFWRNLSDFLTLVSLLAAIGISAVWVSRVLPRGWQIPLSLHYRASARESVNIVGGSNYIYFNRIQWGENPVIGPRASNTAAANAFKQGYANLALDYDNRRLAFKHYHGAVFSTTARGRIAMVGTSSNYGIGMGYFTLLFLVLPALRLPAVIRWVKQRKARKLDHCAKCGYDLRGSIDRCPECGTPASKTGSVWI